MSPASTRLPARRLVPLPALVLLALASPRPAAADGIPTPTQMCPAGSFADSSHCGLACTPSDCKVDADCKGGQLCRQQAVCIQMLDCYSRTIPQTQYNLPNVLKTCSGQGDCANGSTCTAGLRCVPPPQVGCTMELRRRGPATGTALLALVLVLAFADRLRRLQRRGA